MGQLEKPRRVRVRGGVIEVYEDYKVVGDYCKKVILPFKWPVEKGSYRLGNPMHPVAVMLPCIDEDSKKLLNAAIEQGVAIAGFCFTANIGIEKVIANIVSNPNIRWIIVAGRDNEGHRSGDAILKLIENGVDKKTRKIIGAVGASPYINNLPLEIVERFRKQVKAIDMIGIVDEMLLKKVVHGCIQEPWSKVRVEIKNRVYELYDPGAYLDEPLIRVSLERIRESIGLAYRVSETLHIVSAKTLREAYELIVNTVRDYGVEYFDERNLRVREVLNLVVNILEPWRVEVPENFNVNELEEYYSKLIASPFKMGFEYTYGERILAYEYGCSRVNQLDEVIKKLRRNINTRRALIVTWNPLVDLYKEDVPCIVYIQFKSYGEKLHETAVIRSNDVVRAFIPNAYALTRMLIDVAAASSMKVGTLTIHIVSAHEYL